ncbi:hypothetical protein [Paenibacillus mucilaginosus]|uniref:Uncharacterized protein n=1 Tax=Paenibacillus mucilaginosus (strain KNP414) TaxID=1036673 RepID=F8FRG1_PAEMK|nr:hypothetical protein [Paenibacillus mucilaginosus]AEI40518.1 hypothetical protein KNP414_01957 [Paenibacillus mucilaginosus KNP414]MCG7218173.1 hypothetical protein [Paenibacillus mucilaginosus]WDM29687.1 hypothetical protein KCX80_11285 [Paenibacillus mucilaginosus]
MSAFIELIIAFIIGLILTINVLPPVFEYFGIDFTGNVWVNWFGVSILLFSLSSIVRWKIKKTNLLNERITSILFWLLFAASVYVVFIPFVKGENPF